MLLCFFFWPSNASVFHLFLPGVVLNLIPFKHGKTFHVPLLMIYNLKMFINKMENHVIDYNLASNPDINITKSNHELDLLAP